MYVDDHTDPLRYTMAQLRKAMRGMPAEEHGFRGAYNRCATSIAHLVVCLEEAAQAAATEEG